jgi:hypothetical protein
MFNDDDSDNEEEYMDKDEVMKLHREEVEKSFFEIYENGKDISIFLYMPVEFLSAKVRKYLDKYLADHAYNKLFVEHEEFYYKDENVALKPQNEEEEIKKLNKMLEQYLETEEYEKCVNIRDKINSFKEQNNASEK